MDPPGCFPASTPIQISLTQTKPISDIRIGDTVLAFDPAADLGRGALVPRRVVRLYRNSTVVWVRLSWTEGNAAKELIATPGHHFLDRFGHFPTLDDMIRSGRATAVLASGELAEVTAEYIHWSAETAHLFVRAQAQALAVGNAAMQPVPADAWASYNFEVEDLHTYVAGGVRVHNISGGLDKFKDQPAAPPPQLSFGPNRNDRDKTPPTVGTPSGTPLSFGPPPPAGGKTQPPAWTQPSLPLSMGTPVSDRGPKPPQYPLGVPVSGGGSKPTAPVQPKLMPNPSESNRDRQQPPGSGGGWQNDHRDRQAGPSLPASGGSGGGVVPSATRTRCRSSAVWRGGQGRRGESPSACGASGPSPVSSVAQPRPVPVSGRLSGGTVRCRWAFDRKFAVMGEVMNKNTMISSSCQDGSPSHSVA
jgi:hypothetical protein